ncbi:hypothetical protein [Halorarum halobium]|uniref:hypothetical protein n=1 Tax=Halorarum halobium TaxID=3075121 RepID=UPI0028B24FEF|nr:hypothetical protein [Halobaculum sp. XH14]
MRRRTYLSAVGTGMAGLSGCASGTDPGTTGTATEPPTGRHSVTPSGTRTETPRPNPDTIFVDREAGEPGNPGTAEEPLDSIQRALGHARPGETVYVRPGVYREPVSPPRSGEPGAPITITGPPDAILKPSERRYYMLIIRRSHVHLTGLTVDGLKRPDEPDSVESYARTSPIVTRPPPDTDEYLRDLVIAPHGVGNTRKALVAIDRTQNSVVGPFEVIGPGGTKYLLTDRHGHNGEVVYLGTSPSNLGTDWHPWTEYDRTSGIRVHHVDNSAGYAHSELVNTKLGTHDITVEYCTDGGGSKNTEDTPAASMRLQSFDTTVRWCDLRDGMGHGVEIGSYKARDARREGNPSEIERRGGSDNAVYGNRITGFDDEAIAYPVVRGQADQRYVCGNTYDGATDGTPDANCGEEVPTGDGIGHTGGNTER